jgi:hypothetical protein
LDEFYNVVNGGGTGFNVKSKGFYEFRSSPPANAKCPIAEKKSIESIDLPPLCLLLHLPTTSSHKSNNLHLTLCPPRESIPIQESEYRRQYPNPQHIQPSPETQPLLFFSERIEIPAYFQEKLWIVCDYSI